RAMKPRSGVTVFVRGGVYLLTETLTLGAEDSGAEGAPIVYRAVEGEKPVLIGGRPITGFGQHQGQVLKTDVAAQGFKGVRFGVLVFNGKRQEMARYPNRNPENLNGGDWAYVDGDRISMYADMPDDSGYHEQNRHLGFWQRNVPGYKRVLRVKPGDVRHWSRPADGEVSIFPRFNWSHNVLPMESFDASERALTLKQAASYEIRPGDRYFVRNLLEELDSPGEWFLDRQTWTLYFWPPEPLAGKAVYAPLVQSLIQMNGCAHVTVQGFTLECCEDSAVVVKDCAKVVVAGNTIRNAGGVSGCGVVVQGGRENGVVGNDIHEVGSSGIRLGGGDLIRLTPGGNYADNNYIHHVGLVGRGAHGVALTGALNRVSHNLIHDTPHQGIMMWGSKHTIEFNRIRHTCLETEDAGAVGGGAIDWLSWQGAIIRFNWIQDTLGFGYDAQAGRWLSPYFAYALYPDWAASGVHIVGNILVRAPVGCLMVHSGRDNLIENNVLIDGGQRQVDWSGWTTATGFWSTMVEGWIKKYEAAAQHPAWREVPTLTDPRKVPLPDGRVMRGNVFRRNVICYRAPNAALLRFREVPLEHNESDYNLIHHSGLPLLTGYLGLKAERGPNLLANPGLEEGPVGEFPKGWGWMSKPTDKTRALVVEDQAHEGTRSLLVEPGAPEPDAKVAKLVYLAPGPSVPFRPGQAYRLTAWLKAERTPALVGLHAFSWKKDVHNWLVTTTAEVTLEW
ncbi:MAG: right-handed parallel beta-helix repeat-containing protein, partial [Planctomycetes bacterium]|nr:right-handed parallel beta-helix repeat-containing protein [Planctomycetota bacterium]